MNTTNKLPVVILSFPNTRGYIYSGVTIEELIHYFKRHNGGIVYFFLEAVNCALADNLLAYSTYCQKVFDIAVKDLVVNDCITHKQMDNEKRVFHRCCMDVYCYARISLAALTNYQEYSTIDVVSINQELSQATLLLKR